MQLANGAGGLCATPIKSIPQAVCCPSSAQAMPIPGKIAGRSVAEVLHDLYRPQELRRALCALWRDGGVRIEPVDYTGAPFLTDEDHLHGRQ